MAKHTITCPSCGGTETYEIIDTGTQAFSCKACRKTIRVEFEFPSRRVKRVSK